MTSKMDESRASEIVNALNAHYECYIKAREIANKTGHPAPNDTRSWSQILVSLLTDIGGRNREKGSDLDDGSDVKAANCWDAIDTPRFNGVIPAGRKTSTSKKPEDVTALNKIPYLFFVLWDGGTNDRIHRCRVWCVRPPTDKLFRKIAKKWYKDRFDGKIRSDNFQLHPPRNDDSNVFTNNCGNLSYPLLFSASLKNGLFCIDHYDPDVLKKGECSKPQNLGNPTRVAKPRSTIFGRDERKCP